MTENLKNLCSLNGTSGNENSVRDYIISKIDGHCEWRVDNLGNIIAFKKGKFETGRKILLDAHMDEVGIIVTSVTENGFFKFKTVGGIEVPTLMFKKVAFDSCLGVISGKPIHLLSSDERKKAPKESDLYIDIGAASKEEALEKINLGEYGVICGEYEQSDSNVLSKALDDRIGCAILMDLLINDSKYDFYATFSTQEEVGLRGARVCAFSVSPDFAIVLEGTTAADIAGVAESNRVCALGAGPAVSFMDKATVYDRALYDAALQSGIKCQPKSAVTGGNNSGAIHLSKEGVRTLAISVPCRYIHSASSVANIEDIKLAKDLASYMLNGIASGKIG